MDSLTEESLDPGILRLLGVNEPRNAVKLSEMQHLAGEATQYLANLLHRYLRDKTVTMQPAEDGVSIRLVSATDASATEALLNADSKLLQHFKEVEILHDMAELASARAAQRQPREQFRLTYLKGFAVAGFI